MIALRGDGVQVAPRDVRAADVAITDASSVSDAFNETLEGWWQPTTLVNVAGVPAPRSVLPVEVD